MVERGRDYVVIGREDPSRGSLVVTHRVNSGPESSQVTSSLMYLLFNLDTTKVSLISGNLSDVETPSSCENSKSVTVLECFLISSIFIRPPG